MYAGRLVEVGPVERVFLAPAHPYTRSLLEAVPVARPATQRSRRHQILYGEPPDPSALGQCCAFHTRCPLVMDICRTQLPEPILSEGGGFVACHLATAPALRSGSLRGAEPTARNRSKGLRADPAEGQEAPG
jgi:oligopeptide/dipeptide ABC transporter ATP-binding protein